MKDSKLLQLFRTVKQEELRWLAKWVRSPYFNVNKQVVKLFDYLRKYGSDYHSPKLEKEKVFAHIFPGKPFDDNKLRYIMFCLTEQIEEFLMFELLKKDTFQRQRLLYSALGERDLYELFDRKKTEITEQLENDAFKDEYYYLAKWRLEHDHFFHPQTYRYKNASVYLQEMMQNLDAFFMLAKIRYSTELRNRENIFSEEHEIPFVEETKEMASTHPIFGENVIFKVYTDILRLMEDLENEAVYQRLEENVTHNLDLFRPTDQASLIRYMINTTNQLYNKGKSEYIDKQFRLYKIGVEKELFLHEGKLPDSTFLNIIVTASMVGEFEWIEKFIAQLAPALLEEKQADAISLGTAYWYFGKNEFKSSLQLLQKIESSDLQYLLRIKSLSIRCYFELFLTDDTYYELVTYESRAFEKFLRRNELLSEKRVQGYLKFLSIILKLASLKTHYKANEKNLKQLRDKLEKEHTLIARQWLREKIRQIM
ncbi:MAG: hypothetical protein R3B93_21870 [Bacteroidia bacterium]